MSSPVHAERFEPLPAHKVERWKDFPGRDGVWFPTVVGLVLEEVRVDYARFRLPWRSELDQPAGVVHGGALATLIDTCVVPAVASPYVERPDMFTVTMTIQYLAAVVRTDAVAEGWVQKRGRRTVFCRVEVRTDAGELAATGDLVYQVRPASS